MGQAPVPTSMGKCSRQAPVSTSFMSLTRALLTRPRIWSPGASISCSWRRQLRFPMCDKETSRCSVWWATSASPACPMCHRSLNRGFKDWNRRAGWEYSRPPALPASTVDRLDSELVKILREPEVVERFRQGGSEATSTTPAAFAALVQEDYRRWGEVVRRLGVTVN